MALTACSPYCTQVLKSVKNEARVKGLELSDDISVSLLSPEHCAVFVGDRYSEHGACCEANAVFQAIEELIDEEC